MNIFHVDLVLLEDPGIIIQMNETLIFRRKYNRDRNIKQIWIIGGIAFETNNFF